MSLRSINPFATAKIFSNITLVAIVCISISVAFVGCEKSGGTAKKGERRFVTLATAPPGGAFAPVGNAIANVVDTNKGDLKWQVSPQETKGTQENIRKLQAGEVEFGMANAAISYFANKGEGAWKEPHDVRAVVTIAPNVGIFVTTQSTGIKTIADLKGKRVVLGPAGAGFDYFLKPLLKAHGVSYDDLKVLNGTYFTAARRKTLCSSKWKTELLTSLQSIRFTFLFL